jgi:hypothetical protein
MQNAGNLGVMPAGSLVRNGAELYDQVIRRSGRALSFPFGGRRMVVSFQLLPARRATSDLGITPEFDDHELARIAARSGAAYEPAWERSLALQYGGIRRP